MKIVTFEKQHAYDILQHNVVERDAWISGVGDFEDYVSAWKNRGPGFTVINDNGIVMSGGVALLGWRRGEAWLLLSNLFYKYPIVSTKMIRNKLSDIIGQHGLVRVQSLVYPEFNAGMRFIEMLGFECEGLLRSFGPNNEDMLMYAMVVR